MRYLLPAVAIISIAMPNLLATQESPTAGVSADVPAVVNQLGLMDIEVHDRKHRHRNIEGRLPDGTRVEIDLERSGNVEEVEARGRTGFAASAVESIVPAAVREHQSYPADARFHKLELHDGRRVEIEGYRPDGSEFKAEFTADGRLIEFKNR